MYRQLLFGLSDPLSGARVETLQGVNQEELFGQIVLNKIVGAACNGLCTQALNPALRRALEVMREDCLRRSTVFKKHLKYLANILREADFPYALLKGALLSVAVYGHGQRVSNDIDILICPKDVSRLQKLLAANGFVQGYAEENRQIRKAERREIIDARMNTGETVPFVRLTDGELLEVDINFSVDFKASEGALVSELLARAESFAFEDVSFKTLSPADFMLHLACHLYKEATTYDWVKKRRDLMLYKFCDINMFICKYGTAALFSDIRSRTEKYGLERPLYYTLENTALVYPRLNEIAGYVQLKEAVKPRDLRFMRQVVYPREKRLFRYNTDFIGWFFCPDRVSQLEEIPYEEY